MPAHPGTVFTLKPQVEGNDCVVVGGDGAHAVGLVVQGQAFAGSASADLAG
jgi:hypothetical protein